MAKSSVNQRYNVLRLEFQNVGCSMRTLRQHIIQYWEEETIGGTKYIDIDSATAVHLEDKDIELSSYQH